MLGAICRVLIVNFALCGLAMAQALPSWRYDLHPGDHLVYAYTFHREIHSDDTDSVIEARFHTHVLIGGVREGITTAGFQRNRDSSELQAYHVKGKDKLSEERPKFEKRMRARPTQFSEAMEFNAIGEPQYSWEVARESPSHLLPALHEVEVLPVNAPKPGEKWRATNPLGMEFEWMGTETAHGKSCNHVKGTTADGSVTLSYWWSPESGVIERIELNGTYPVFGGSSHERATMDLESLTRNESIGNWLDKSETRLGTLEALLLSPNVEIRAEQLASVAKGSDAGVQRLVAAIARRRGLPLAGVPSADIERQPRTNDAPVTQPTDSTSKNCPPLLSKKPEVAKFGTLFRVAMPEKAGPGVPYFLRIPLTYRADSPTPLLVYLSGGAGFALDGVSTANDAVANTDYLVLYPQAGEYWWKPEVAQRVDAALRDTFKEFNVDRDRVYITGFSNGGTGALYMAELWPQRFAAVVSLMGAGQCNEDVQRMLPNLANLPMLFVHGEKDPIISPECSKTTFDAIGELRPRTAPQLRVLPDREHDLTLASDDGLALAFFKDKVREAFPKRVTMRVPDLTFPRQYWIEVLEKKSGIADVTAEIKSNNQIEIHSHEVTKIALYLYQGMFSKPGPVQVKWNGKQVFEGAVREVCAAEAGATGDPKLEFADRKELLLP